MEVVVATALAPGCSLLAQRFASALDRDSALRIDVLDVALAAAGLGSGMATATLMDGAELHDAGVIAITKGVVGPSRSLLRFILRGTIASPLLPFEHPRPTPQATRELFLQGRTEASAVIDRMLGAGRPLLLSGTSGFGASELLQGVADLRGVTLRVVELTAVFNHEAGVQTDLMAQLHCEARLIPAIWLLVGLESTGRNLLDKPLAAHRLIDRLHRIGRPIVLCHEGPVEPELAARFAALGGLAHVDLPPLEQAERTALWQATLQAGGVTEAGASELSRSVDHLALGVSQIATAAAHAMQRAQAAAAHAWSRGEPVTEVAPTVGDLSLAATTAMTSRPRRYGSRVDSRSTWDDLVLAQDVLAQVRDLARFARLRDKLFDEYGFGDSLSYGRALSAMFSGPSGTGKTMVAGLIARELGVELYRVDLSRVVSKYIGETEERLGMLFSEATQVGAALLFDEADSMFGARTEIKSSNDRYANLEVNYLLQRLEDFDGVVILTTNFAASVDEAFLRRLRFRVQFPFPDAAQRARLWQVMLPARLPVDAEDLDLEWMGASFELSGGHIRSAVLRGGMFAADADGPLSMRMLYDAAATEYRELGKIAPAYPFDDDDSW